MAAPAAFQVETTESSIKKEFRHEKPDQLSTGHSPKPDFVEGTLRGWLAVLGGHRIYISQESPSTISWIGSIQLALQFIVGVFSGKLFDKGYFHPLMVSGSLLILFSSFMLSLAKPHQFYQVLLSQGFGFGIGSGLVFLPSLGIASHYFRRRRAVAMGIMISSGSFGGIVYSILLNKILPRPEFGFPWAVRFVSFINLVLLLVANLIMKPRCKSMSLSALPPNAAPVDMNQIRADRPYWITNIGLFLGSLGVFIPYFYLQLFAVTRDVDPKFLTWVIPILNAGAMVGRLMPCFLADIYGPLNVLIPCGFISGALMWALLGVKSVAGVTIFALVYGFISGAFLSLTSPSVAAFSTSPSMNDTGLRIGISCLFMGFALLGGNPIAGALLSAPAYKWWRPLTFGCVVMITGSGLILYARRAVVLRRGRQRV
ncbi:MFS general substrate transporter [Mycena pura]|uniref:MFS general substrate transporter n=1 Tax=Mycena pura TaxID=153505 RepID=A0AAD6UZI4_9AGAR|nr:MFS general substrate transporter [Mycena pura]